jgi:hypothetical protein
MNKTRKIKIAIVGIWSVALLLLVVPAYFLVFSHDLYLQQLNRSLAGINHPLDTKLISSSKDLGLLVGNSNHCDYFVAELRNYNNLSPKQIETFYKDTKIWNPLNRRRERVSIGIIEKGKIRSNEDWMGAGDFLKDYFKAHLPQKLGNQRLYFVFFLDVGNEVGCDVRCI